MTTIGTYQTPTLEGALRAILSLLGRLVRELRDGHGGSGELDALREPLEALPLTTDEFSLAINRLANSHRYLQGKEAGAARWELNALRQQLLKHTELRQRFFPS